MLPFELGTSKLFTLMLSGHAGQDLVPKVQANGTEKRLLLRLKRTEEEAKPGTHRNRQAEHCRCVTSVYCGVASRLSTFGL